jgi:hypothetical protein
MIQVYGWVLNHIMVVEVEAVSFAEQGIYINKRTQGVR